MDRKLERLAPITGAIFFVLLIVSFVISGEGPDAKDDPADIVDFYMDNEGTLLVGAFLAVAAATALVFFGAYIRKLIAEAAGRDEMLSSVAMVGFAIYATGIAIDATVVVALTSTAGDIEPTSSQALSALYENDFVPFALGSLLLLLATGIAALKHGVLPRWLGWVAIVLAVLLVTPVGFIGFLGGGIWILVVSIVLTLRAGETAPGAGAA